MKVISLFSGAGGLDIGFEQAGFEVVVAVEADPACCNTLKKNKPSLKVIEGDVSKITGKEILKAAGLKRTEAALVIGGPPCQSFSLAGQRMGLDDERGSMIIEFSRLVHEILPIAFVMENVKGMLNWEGGRAIDAVLNEFKEPAIYRNKKYLYEVTYSVLNAVNYGVPQKRERLFVVGNRLGIDFKFPSPTHGDSDLITTEKLQPFKTTWDAIGNLPKAEEPSDTAKRVSQSIKGRIAKHGY
jgi:DNA (cytosine-5)-methyltransferase 1